MSDALLIAVLVLLPALAALVLPLLPRGALARSFSMAVMLVVLALALSVFTGFDGRPGPERYALDLSWMPSLGVSLHWAVDGLNVYLVLLTALLFPIVLACAWATTEAASRLYLGLLLALQAGLMGTFLAQDLVLLFVLWEAVLVPMVLLMLVFGGPRRRQAAVSFFLYTMAGSVFFLAAVILLGVEHLNHTGRWSFDLQALAQLHLSPVRQMFVFLSLALACAVKSPLFPFHSWLPLAYGEASPSGTALMAGVMSKMGAFGFMKLVLPLCPDVAPMMAPYMVTLAVISILYGAVLALRQQDVKQLVAYASLSHMGYIVLGLFSFQATAVHGALFQILSHGLGVAGLFLLLGLLEQRCGPSFRQLDALSIRAPMLAVVMMLFVLASLALPLTSGFTAEFLILLGAFTQGLASWRAGAGVGLMALALLASLGVVLGATYMLRMARAMLFGPQPAAGSPRVADLSVRELLALAPMLLLMLWIGVWPAPMMSKVEAAAIRLSAPHTAAATTATHTALAVEGTRHGQ